MPVTGREGLYGCARLRLQNYLDNRLKDDGKVVSPRAGPALPPSFFKIPGTHFC
jgi:hypothetical protein